MDEKQTKREKPGCWSTNHSQHERDKSRKKFEKERPYLRDRGDFNKTFQRFLLEYEGDSIDEIDQFFEEFVIDIATDETYFAQPYWTKIFESNKQFFTSLGALENSESLVTTRVLADNSFKHRIIGEDMTSPNCWGVKYEDMGPNAFSIYLQFKRNR